MTTEIQNTAEIEATLAYLNASWDDIEDLPEYINPPTGSYKCLIEKAELKEPNAKQEVPEPSIRVHLEITEVMECDAEEQPKAGSKVMFTYKGKKGVQNFKKQFLPLAAAISATGPMELIDRMAGCEVAVVMQSSPSDNPDRPYTNIRTLMPV